MQTLQDPILLLPWVFFQGGARQNLHLTTGFRPPPQVLSIAVLLKVVMKRSFTVTQWEALVLLILGITVNQLACSSHPSGSVPETLSILAWVYTMMSVTIPSAASVYNEHALKSNFDTSVHLQVTSRSRLQGGWRLSMSIGVPQSYRAGHGCTRVAIGGRRKDPPGCDSQRRILSKSWEKVTSPKELWHARIL
jgi:hypothetical protein